ncbi:MAG: MFS transporter [Dehalococcoidia bacterium]|nr:MFS transporter [Dehalococcoidia bacterium]
MEAATSGAMQSNIRKYYVFHFFLNFQLWWPIWVLYLTEKRGLTLAEVTLIDIPFWLSIVLLQIPAAAIADRWGRKPTLIAAAAAFAAAITFFGLASTFWLILCSYMIWGIAFSLLFGTESAFIYDTLKALGREEEYPKIYGRGWAVMTGAAVAGTLVGAPLAAATDLSIPIVLSGGIAAMAALTALTFHEPLAPQARTSPALPYGQIIRESLDIARRPAVRYSILFFGLITIGSIAPIFFFQPFLSAHGVSTGEVGIWQTPMRIAGIIGALLAHRFILALGERRTFYLMPLGLIAGYSLLALWDSVYAQVAFPLIYFVVVLSQPTATDYLNRRVPSEQRATVVSLTNLARSAVLIPSAPLLGLLADEASTSAAFAAGGIIIAVLGLPLMLLWLPHLRGAGQEERALEATGEPGGE